MLCQQILEKRFTQETAGIRSIRHVFCEQHFIASKILMAYFKKGMN